MTMLMACLFAYACSVAGAQQQLPPQQPPQQHAAPQVMGTVPTKDALVTGGLEVKGDRARLMNNASVTATGRTADVKLERGGNVMVCAASQVHLLHAGGAKALLFGLDRGALELHTAADARDVILTPDIRFTVESKGSFDLALRVARNGDTCVENGGNKAPVLTLSDAFSQASYRLMPGQHVQFEHGNLRQAIDNESAPCGCPGAGGHVDGKMSAAEKASAEHPFPAAASAGVAGEQPVENSPAGEKQTQISTTFAYGEGQGPPPSTLPVNGGASGEESVPVRHRSFGAKVRHFFYRMFHP